MKVLTKYKMHHPNSDIDRLYVNRRGGGRGMLEVEATYKAGMMINIAEYWNTKYTENQCINICYKLRKQSTKCGFSN